MKMIIESTAGLITFNNIPMRIWDGETEDGVKVKCLIALVIINKNEKRKKEFEDCLFLNPDADLADFISVSCADG